MINLDTLQALQIALSQLHCALIIYADSKPDSYTALCQSVVLEKLAKDVMDAMQAVKA